MEKVKITQEQADALESTNNLDEWMIVAHHTTYKNAWAGKEVSLNDLALDTLIKALYIGYEVEPEFNPGDWVFNKKYQRVAIVNMFGVDEKGVRVDDREYNHIYQLGDVRHATPEEIKEEKTRRWWESNGRDVWELKKGDVLYDIEIGGFAEIRRNYTLRASARSNYKIACFSHDRKDV